MGGSVALLMAGAMLTPPIGLNVFVMTRIAPEVPMGQIFRGVTPFVLVCLIVVALLTAFPRIALWLPSLM